MVFAKRFSGVWEKFKRGRRWNEIVEEWGDMFGHTHKKINAAALKETQKLRQYDERQSIW